MTREIPATHTTSITTPHGNNRDIQHQLKVHLGGADL